MAAVKAGWRRVRSWPVWVQAVLAVAVASSIAVASGDDEPAADLRATTTGDIAEVLPMASTTSTASELPPSSTSTTSTTTSTTTTTTAPPPSTTTSTTTATTAPPPAPAPAPQAIAGSSCHPSYDPCVPVTSDVDCAGGSGNGPEYTGRVTVHGPDDYDLDRDGDGVGCE